MVLMTSVTLDVRCEFFSRRWLWAPKWQSFVADEGWWWSGCGAKKYEKKSLSHPTCIPLFLFTCFTDQFIRFPVMERENGSECLLSPAPHHLMSSSRSCCEIREKGNTRSLNVGMGLLLMLQNTCHAVWPLLSDSLTDPSNPLLRHTTTACRCLCSRSRGIRDDGREKRPPDRQTFVWCPELRVRGLLLSLPPSSRWSLLLLLLSYFSHSFIIL